MKFRVETKGKKIKRDQQVDVIEKLDLHELEPFKFDMKTPEVVFLILFGDDEVFFGCVVASGRQSEHDAHFHFKYGLKVRPYLSPTCLDHELAFLMANQAKVTAGALVYDPFVGSGSIAIACAHFGALVIGSDLDERVLTGSSVGRKSYNKDVIVEHVTNKDENYNIFTNFKHYGLPLPDIF